MGAPTGGKPNQYSGRGLVTLPNNGMIVAYSNAYWQSLLPGDERPAILPDLFAPPTVSDLWAGRDRALELAMDDPTRPGIASVLRPVLEASGVAAALREYRRSVAQERNRYDFGEEELDGLGSALLESGSADAAVAILALNIEAFPWSANAHDSLADALLAGGDSAGARGALCRAFRIDRDYDRLFGLATARQASACLGG